MSADFKQLQHVFTQFIRTPHSRKNGVTKLPFENIDVYSRLVLNNVQAIVSQCFPVTIRILGQKRWQKWTSDFFVSHFCQTPYFYALPKAFLFFLETQENNYDYPFLYALAHYEWLELYIECLDVEMDKAQFVDDKQTIESLVLNLSGLAAVGQYDFDVHNIGKTYLPSEKKETTLIIYRDEKHQVHFEHLNPLSAVLLKAINENDCSVQEVLEAIALQMSGMDKEAFIAFGKEIVQKWCDEGILILPFKG